MEKQPESIASTDRKNKNIREEERSIETVIEDVNSQEDIDLLIARLQTKKRQGAMMSKRMGGCITVEVETLLPPEKPLDWDNI